MYQEKKQLVMSHYSEKLPAQCKNCGSRNNLQIDHPNEDGKEERKKHGSGGSFYHYLIKNDYPKGYAVLCRKCNIIKSIIYHELCIRSLSRFL